MNVKCSKGTYIRSLAQDVGEKLGVGGHVSALHRSQAGPFVEADMVTLESLEAQREGGGPELLDSLLAPVDATITDLPETIIDANSAHCFCMGQTVVDDRVYQVAKQGDKVRVRHENGQFLGVAQVADESRLAPKRLVVY